MTKKSFYAPISQNAKDYLNKYLNHNKTDVADYYFSKELPKELMTEYKAFFKSDVLPYTYKMFPQTKKHTKHPTFVFLGNHEELSTIKFAKRFYSEDLDNLPYGWFYRAENITVMTQLGYEAPLK